MMHRPLLILAAVLLQLPLASSFQAYTTNSLQRAKTSTSMFAKKKSPKKNKPAGGGGFGAAPAADAKPKPVTIPADKTALEKQWDTFVGITDLEIKPLTDDENFRVVDVFVRSAGTAEKEGTKWFRIGKVCQDGAEGVNSTDINMHAALTVQKGLIFWTAVHMRRELVAAGGKSGAASLELGFTDSSMTTGAESDPPLDEDEETFVELAERVSVADLEPKSFGFRPDWNPPGFTYKRREKAAMKKNKMASPLDEIAAIGEEG